MVAVVSSPKKYFPAYEAGNNGVGGSYKAPPVIAAKLFVWVMKYTGLRNVGFAQFPSHVGQPWFPPRTTLLISSRATVFTLPTSLANSRPARSADRKNGLRKPKAH